MVRTLSFLWAGLGGVTSYSDGPRKKLRETFYFRFVWFYGEKQRLKRYFSERRSEGGNHEDVLLLGVCLSARRGARLLSDRPTVSAQSSGVQPSAGIFRQNEHLDLSREQLPPAGDHHRAAQRWEPDAERQPDGPGLRGQLALPPHQARDLHPKGRPGVRLPGDPHGEDQHVQLGIGHVSSRLRLHPGRL